MTSDKPPIVSCDGERLLINAPTDVRAAIRFFPRPYCVVSSATGRPWIRLEPVLNIQNESLTITGPQGVYLALEPPSGVQVPEIRTSQLRSALSPIPPQVRAALQPFQDAWPLLVLLQRAPNLERGLEFLAQSPALFAALAFSEPNMRRNLPRLRELLVRPHRDVAEALGFPASRSLRKVPPELCDSERIAALRDALQHSGRVARLLAYAPSPVTRPVMEILLTPELNSCAGDRLIESWDSLSRSPRDLVQTIKDMIQMRQGAGLAPRLYETARDLDDDYRLMQESLTPLPRRAPRGPGRGTPAALPSPPFPGPEAFPSDPDFGKKLIVRPLNSRSALRKESEDQRNCLSDPAYFRAVMRGTLYVYSVLAPVRGTLSVTRLDYSSTSPMNIAPWRIQSLKAAGDLDVSLWTYRLVEMWVRVAQTPPDRACPPLLGHDPTQCRFHFLEPRLACLPGETPAPETEIGK